MDELSYRFLVTSVLAAFSDTFLTKILGVYHANILMIFQSWESTKSYEKTFDYESGFLGFFRTCHLKKRSREYE